MKYLLIASIGFVFGVSGPAQADVRDVFACNYVDGKGMSDLMSARDFYLKQAKKAGIEAPEAFVWNLYKGTSNAEVLWFNNFSDMVAFGKNADAGAASAEMAEIFPRFAEVVDCESVLVQRETVYEGSEPPVANPPALISSNACVFNKGFGQGDLKDLWGHVAGVLGSMDEYKDGLFYASTPVTRSLDSPDLYLYGVSENVTEWASDGAALRASEAGQGLIRHFGKVLDCSSSLWTGTRVVPAQ